MRHRTAPVRKAQGFASAMQFGLPCADRGARLRGYRGRMVHRTPPIGPDDPSPPGLPLAQPLALEPLRDHTCDRGIVLLDHHHVAVAVHADVGQPDE